MKLKLHIIALFLLAFPVMAVDVVLGRLSDLTWTGEGGDKVASFGVDEWSPLSIADCKMWLDAADAATVLTTGTAVTNWLDKSMAGNHAVQTGDAGFRPTYESAGQNGLNVMNFQAATTHMTTPFLNGNDITVFAVVWRRAGQGESSRVFLGITDPSTTRSFWATRQVSLAHVGAGTLSKADMAYEWGGDTFSVFTGAHGSGTVSIWRNGSLSDTSAYSGNAANDTYAYYVGAGNKYGSPTGYLVGMLAEVIIYNRVLTDVERNRVVDYLMQKWGIP